MSDEKWLRQLTSLNQARNNAPHKPLLLLVFLDMVEAGEYSGGPSQPHGGAGVPLQHVRENRQPPPPRPA